MLGVHDFELTTDNLGILNPFISPPNAMATTPGIFLGYGLNGPLYFDPWKLKEIGYFEALIFGVVGEIGCGKSTLVKALTSRLSSISASGGHRQIRISTDAHKELENGARRYNDRPFTEYTGLAHHLGSEEIDLGRMSFNLLDPRLGMTQSEMLSLLQAVIRHLRTNDTSEGDLVDISTTDSTVLRTAYELLVQTLPENERTLESLIRILNRPDDLNPSIGGGELLTIDRTDLGLSASRLTQTFIRLTGGDFGNMFSGNASIWDYLSQPFVGYDYTGISGSNSQMALLQTMIWAWRSSIERRELDEAKVELMVADENPRMWRHKIYADSMYDHIKLVRAKARMIIMATQRISDYLTISDRVTENITEDFTGWFIGRTKLLEAKRLQERFGFSNRMREIIINLPKGHFLFYIPNQATIYLEFPITDRERVFTESDQANAAALRRNVRVNLTDR